MFTNRFNSLGYHCLDCHSPAVDEWLSAVWDWRFGIKPGKWNIFWVKFSYLFFLQLSAGEFKEAMETRAPRLMICSVEFVANEEVLSFSNCGTLFIKKIWYTGAQCSVGQPSCPPWEKASCCHRWSSSVYLKISGTVMKCWHCQVLDPDHGWSNFREHYASSTWQWLTAATKARSEKV